MDINPLIVIIIGVIIIGFLLYQSNKEEKSSCQHEWVTIKEINVYQYSYDKLPCGVKYILRCKKCGDIKEREFKG